MKRYPLDPIWKMLGVLYKSHPWHGVPIGEDTPKIVTAYIEMVPTDTVKYEIEKTISHGDILLHAIPIGGLRMIDGNEADDKIIAVMQGDAIHNSWREIEACPSGLIERLRHYFLTYKDAPGSDKRHCEITHVFGREEAYEVIRRSQEDYKARYGDHEALLTAALKNVR